jgi:phage gp29-like protein
MNELKEVAPIPQADTIEELITAGTPGMTMVNWRGEMHGDLDWGKIESILRGAEIIGATDIWAKLTRRMYQDGKILALRATRLSPIAGAKVNTSSAGPRDIDERAAADVLFMLKSLPNLPAILDHFLDAIMVGYSVGEIIWEQRGQWIWPVGIEMVSPDRIRFDQLFRPYLYDNGVLAGCPGSDPSVNLNGKPLTENKYIVHMPRAIPDYPVAAGLLRACVRYWWVKWQATKYWMSGAELAGNPRIIGKYPQAASSNAKQQLFEALVNLSATSTLAVSEDVSVEMLKPEAVGAGGVWSGLTEWADKGLTLSILGSDMNTEAGKNGSRALAASQGEYTIDPRLVMDSSALWATFKDQLIVPFLKFNSFRYDYAMPAVPNVESVFVDLIPTIDKDIIESGTITKNDLRVSRGLEKLNNSDGDTILNEKKKNDETETDVEEI